MNEKENILEAAISNDWERVTKTLEEHPNIDINATLQEGSNAGCSILYQAASNKNWVLVLTILEQFPYVDVNLTPQNSATDYTVLRLAADSERWDIVLKILQGHPEVDIKAPRPDGEIQFLSLLFQGELSEQKIELAKYIYEFYPESHNFISDIDIINDINYQLSEFYKKTNLLRLVDKNTKKAKRVSIANALKLIAKKELEQFHEIESFGDNALIRKRDLLQRALTLAIRSSELSPTGTNAALVTEIKNKVIETYCNSGAIDDAIAFMQENLDAFKHPKDKARIYRVIGNAFVIINSNGSTNERRENLLSACAYLTEAVELNKSALEKITKNKDAITEIKAEKTLVEGLLCTSLDALCGGNGFKSNFEDIRKNEQFLPVVQKITKTKVKVFSDKPVKENKRSGLSSFCDVLQIKNLESTKKVLSIFPESFSQLEQEQPLSNENNNAEPSSRSTKRKEEEITDFDENDNNSQSKQAKRTTTSSTYNRYSSFNVYDPDEKSPDESGGMEDGNNHLGVVKNER